MGFVPRLPTWNTDFTPYLYDAATDTWAEGVVFEGQLYTMKRVAEVLGTEAMYVVHPKEDDQLRDPTQLRPFRWDVITFDWRGVQTWWFVEQHVPRWLGFPNEHKLALIRRMTQDEIDLVLNNLPPHAGNSTIEVDPLSVIADGVEAVAVTVTLRDHLGRTLPNRYVVVTPSDNAVSLAPAAVMTDSSGVAIFAATSETPVEDVTFTANSGGVNIGPSATVDFLPGEGIPYLPNCSIDLNDSPADADGVDTLRVSVTIRDSMNNPIEGWGVQGNVTIGSGVDLTFGGDFPDTDVNGVSEQTVTSTTVQSGVYFQLVIDLDWKDSNTGEFV